MLFWQAQDDGYALRQCDANGNNKRPPVILAGETEYVIFPQRALIYPTLILRPQGAAVATVDLCHDWIEDIKSFLNQGGGSLIWDPSVLGNVTAASTPENSRLYFAGSVSAARIVAAGGSVWLRGNA
jgi:hypothetical protein